MTRERIGALSARLGAGWVVCLAFFVFVLGCGGPKEGSRRVPLVLVLPQSDPLESGVAAGLAGSAALNLRNAFGGELRVSGVPECLSALPLDSLVSPPYVDTLVKKVGADAAVLVRVGRRRGVLRFEWRLVRTGGGTAWATVGESWKELIDRVAREFGLEPKREPPTISSIWKLRESGRSFYHAAGVRVEPYRARKRGYTEVLGWARAEAMLRDLAELRLADEDLTDALYRLGEFLTRVWHDTSSTEWCRLRGAYFVYAERWSQAEKWLERAYRRNPRDGRTLYWLAHLHPSRLAALQLGGWEEALRRAVEYNPLLFDARLQLVDLYFHNRRFRAARREIDALLAINPDHERGLMMSGRLYITQNDIPNVLKTYKRVLDLNPANADAYYNLGIVYFHTGKLEDAEKLFRRAVEINNYRDAHLYLGLIYEKLGRTEDAIREYRVRIRLRKGPDDEFADEARQRLFAILHAASDTVSVLQESSTAQ